MHMLAFLFFSGLIALSALLIRGMFAESDAKIEAALAGEHRLQPPRDAVIYIARRRASPLSRPRTTVQQRLAA